MIKKMNSKEVIIEAQPHVTNIENYVEPKISIFNEYLEYARNFNKQWYKTDILETMKTSSNHDLIKLADSEISQRQSLDLCSFSRDCKNADLGSISSNIPFDIKYFSDSGRQIISRRNVAAGEVILIEKPLILAPLNDNPCCLSCMIQTNFDFKCVDCGFPFCNEMCLNKDHAIECFYLQKLELGKQHASTDIYDDEKIKTKLQELPEDQRIEALKMYLSMKCSSGASKNREILQNYIVIPVIRTLILSEKSQFLNELVNSLQGHSHIGSRQNSIIDQIMKCVEDHFDQKFVEFLVSMWDTNSFQVPISAQGKLQGIYPGASMLNHSCRANIQTMFTDNGTMILRALENIPKFTPLTIRYTDPLWPTRVRNDKLLKTKNFSCLCNRCTSPSECNSYLGSILCSKCKSPMCPIDPLVKESNWKCIKCDQEVTSKQVSSKDMFLSVNLLKVKNHELSSVKEVIEKMKEEVHPNYYLIIKISLSSLSYFDKKDLQECSDDELNTLKDLSKSCLDVYSILEAPLATKRGKIAKSYLRCSLEIARRKKNEGKGENDTLKDLNDLLQECSMSDKWNSKDDKMASIRNMYHELVL